MGDRDEELKAQREDRDDRADACASFIPTAADEPGNRSQVSDAPLEDLESHYDSRLRPSTGGTNHRGRRGRRSGIRPRGTRRACAANDRRELLLAAMIGCELGVIPQALHTDWMFQAIVAPEPATQFNAARKTIRRPSSLRVEVRSLDTATTLNLGMYCRLGLGQHIRRELKGTDHVLKIADPVRVVQSVR